MQEEVLENIIHGAVLASVPLGLIFINHLRFQSEIRSKDRMIDFLLDQIKDCEQYITARNNYQMYFNLYGKALLVKEDKNWKAYNPIQNPERFNIGDK